MAAIGLRNDGGLDHMECYDAEQRKDRKFLKTLKILLRPDAGSFPLLRNPEAGDWLSTRNGEDQTFKGYVKNHGHRRPNKRGYEPRKIYLLPLVASASDKKDLKGAGFPDSEALESIVTAFFCLSVVMLNPMTVKELPRNGKKIQTWHEEREATQYNARDILRCLEARKPADAHALMAFTMLDLSKPGYNYLFGLGSTTGAGVFSFFRQDPASAMCEFWNGTSERQEGDDEVLLNRASMTLCHELGHTLGLKHCTFFSCLMQGANSLEEAEDRGGCRLCPCCLRKLCWAVGASPETHYQALLDHCTAWPGPFAEDLEWVAGRLSTLEAARAHEADAAGSGGGGGHGGGGRGRGAPLRRGGPPICLGAGAAGDGAGVPISLPKLAAGQAKRLTAVTGTSVSLPAKPTKKPAVSAPARVLALAGAAKSNSGTAGGVLGVGMSDLLAGLEAA